MEESSSHDGNHVHRSMESIICQDADFIDFDIAKVLGTQAATRNPLSPA